MVSVVTRNFGMYQAGWVLANTLASARSSSWFVGGLATLGGRTKASFQLSGTVITIQWPTLSNGLHTDVTGSPASRSRPSISAATAISQTVWFSSGGAPAATIGRIGLSQ